MREMKDSGVAWIGEIPKEWRVIRVKNLADSSVADSFIDGDWIESQNITDSGIRYLTTGNVGDGIYKEQGSGYISLNTFKELNCKYAYPGDLVISRLNAPYGRACILPDTKSEYVLAVDVVILRTKENKHFLCYQMQCEGYQRSVEDFARGTAMKRISRTNLGNVSILCPPLSEQQKIASLLDKKCTQIDTLISIQQQQIEKLKAYKQSLITEVVTKGLNPDVPMKDSGVEWIGEIPEHWNIVKLKIVVSKVGSGKTPLGGAETYLSKGILFLRSQNIYDNCLNLDEPTYISEEADEEMKNTRVYPNDVLLNITGGSIGRCCIFPNELIRANVNQHVSIIRVIEKFFTPKFMHYFWISYLGKISIDLYQTGGNREGMSADAIKNTRIVLLPITEQNKITFYLDKKCSEIDSLIAIKQQKIEKLQQYKKSVIYEYVTGKKEVE